MTDARNILDYDAITRITRDKIVYYARRSIQAPTLPNHWEKWAIGAEHLWRDLAQQIVGRDDPRFQNDELMFGNLYLDTRALLLAEAESAGPVLNIVPNKGR